MNWNHLRTVRWLIAGFGLGVGLVLVAAGQGLIGGALVVMGGVRILMLLTMNRRMGTYRGGGARGGSAAGIPRAGRVGGRRDEMLLRLSRNELDVAATTIGVAPDELRRAVDDGRTISAVAADASIPTARVVDAIVRDATATVDRGVAAGNVAADRAQTLQSRLPHWAERFVLSTPAMLAGTQPRI